MPDKKLTDNEIVKALKICGTYKGKCTDCPAFIKVDRSNCKQVLLGAIEIINRKKEEIEELKSAINGFRGYEDKIKAEAYKEFAERIKKKAMQKFDWNEYVEVEDIDNLLKEKVGENK